MSPHGVEMLNWGAGATEAGDVHRHIAETGSTIERGRSKRAVSIEMCEPISGPVPPEGLLSVRAWLIAHQVRSPKQRGDIRPYYHSGLHSLQPPGPLEAADERIMGRETRDLSLAGLHYPLI